MQFSQSASGHCPGAANIDLKAKIIKLVMMLIQTHCFYQRIRAVVSLAGNKSGTGGGWEFCQGRFQEAVIENTGSVCSLDSGGNFLTDSHVTTKFMRC